MKVLRYSLLMMLMCFSMTIISSCGNNKQADDKSGKEYTSAYICPMHCEGSGSDKAGNCLVCKMDYVANPDVIKEEVKQEKHNHDHDHDHHGHDHSHDGHNH